MRRFGFRYDPIPPLLCSTDQVIRLRAAHELNGEDVDYAPILEQKPVKRAIARQLPDGSWKYPGRRAGSEINYEYLETYRNIGELVELYALDKEHPAVGKAAEFLFSLQTEEGDFRGIYGRQYSPNYTAGVLEVLLHAGCGNDPRTDLGLRWLFSMRQEDGGWAVPLRTNGWNFRQPMPDGPLPVPPNRSKPSSHMVTGIVLRTMAASDRYRHADETRLAGNLLASRLFFPDRYSDRGRRDFWTKFSFPFWFTDLVSSLDSLSLIGIGPENEQVDMAIEWFRSRQRKDGTWRLQYLKGAGISIDEWVHFALCRAVMRYSVIESP
jgi:hypothetical protein